MKINIKITTKGDAFKFPPPTPTGGPKKKYISYTFVILTRCRKVH
jgi:hypothetical protein